MTKRLISVFVVASVLVAQAAFANHQEKKTWGYVEMQGGVASVSDSNWSKKPTGRVLSPAIGFVHFGETFNLDGTLGYLQTNLKGAVAGVDQKFQKGHGQFSLSPALRLGHALSIGPVGSVIFGGDSPNFTNQEETKGAKFLGGLRATLDLSSDDVLFRLVAQGLTDINIKDRQATLLTGGIQLGLPVGPQTAAAPVVAEQPVVVEPAKIVEAPKAEVAKPEVVASLGVNAINFKPGSAVLSAGSKAKLKKIGAFLKARNSDWNGLEVGGHTDVTGKEPKNVTLSQARADAVKKAIAAGGADAARISAKGYGSSQPIDAAKTKAAYAKNRRVELAFDKVKSADIFNADLLKVLK